MFKRKKTVEKVVKVEEDFFTCSVCGIDFSEEEKCKWHEEAHFDSKFKVVGLVDINSDWWFSQKETVPYQVCVINTSTGKKTWYHR